VRVSPARRSASSGLVGREREADRLGAALDRHARQRARAFGEDRLELGLAHHVRLRPARDAALRIAPEQDQRLARGVLRHS
jgi:hypothetical protein